MRIDAYMRTGISLFLVRRIRHKSCQPTAFEVLLQYLPGMLRSPELSVGM